MASAAACGALASLEESPGYANLDATRRLYAEEWHRGLLHEGGVPPPTAVKVAVYMAQQGYSRTNVRLWTSLIFDKLAAALQKELVIDELQALSIVAAVEAASKAPGGAQPDGGRISSISSQPSGFSKKPRKKQTPEEANRSEQKWQVRAIADAWYFKLVPPPAKTDLFGKLTKDPNFEQGVKAAEAEGHAAAQAIADKLPGCKCRWRESDVRTKLRQRFNYLKDPQKAIAAELKRREKKREASQSRSRAGGTSMGATTGSMLTGSETAVVLAEPAHSDAPAAPATGSGRASCSANSQPAPAGAATEAAAPTQQAQARDPAYRGRTRANTAALISSGTDAGRTAEGAEAAAAGSRGKRGRPSGARTASPGGGRAGRKRTRSSAAGANAEDAGKSREEIDAAAIALLFAGLSK